MVDRKDAKYRLKINLKDQPEQHQSSPLLFYLSDYWYGGCTTFTAHLLHILTRKYIICLTKAFEKDIGVFGYGIHYQRKPMEFLDEIKRMFIADMFRNFHLLDKLKDKDITIVVHDPGEIFNENVDYLKKWNVIVIRKTVLAHLKREYGIKAKFLYHPFYPYKNFASNIEEKEESENIITINNNDKTEAVSISRIDAHKNIDVILRANKKIKKNPVKIYGLLNASYVYHNLKKLDFDKHYHGMFDKSFSQVSAILGKSKFMVDLIEIPNDGGGTQYTFLEAIYNNSAIILNRKWIETVDKKYRDFKEGYNCYAVSDEQELVEMLNNSNNIDTTKVVENASKLMHRHIDTAKDWDKAALEHDI
jgi:glycosyltransferase involved in cell wall biosynthesis